MPSEKTLNPKLPPRARSFVGMFKWVSGKCKGQKVKRCHRSVNTSLGRCFCPKQLTRSRVSCTVYWCTVLLSLYFSLTSYKFTKMLQSFGFTLQNIDLIMLCIIVRVAAIVSSLPSRKWSSWTVFVGEMVLEEGGNLAIERLRE